MVISSKYTAAKDNGNGTFVLNIPTKTGSPDPAQDRQIDLSQMDEQDLKSLHKSDPFMYYSIPEVLDASINLKDVDYSDIISRSRKNANSNLSSDPPQFQSRHNREEAGDDAVAAGKVSRKSRVSFECHPSVLVEAMMDDLDLEFGDESLCLDDIMSLFDSRCSLSRQ